ncbi:alpha-1,2-fucosyltransferase [Polluticoccus soli]|uniref:alpha-1,2-fucosyltransferase n=1 Tax=Polluticoccus soli TaxID=3034150 RepID=UPI0023E2638B|nr:alpha-1,2-fucosyltransferase [Flavipsychrobacter sp. JY13-12]
MIIVKLQGGLGNQMFQYAIGKSLAKHLGTSFKLDVEFLLDRTPRENFVFRDYDLDIFSLQAPVATKAETLKFKKTPGNKLETAVTLLRNKLSPVRYFYEPHFHFVPQVFELPRNSYLDGYWQTPRYFESIEQEIRNDFGFKDQIIDTSKELRESILNTNSVCINVRRADFLTNDFHGVCDMRYFEPGIEIVTSKVKDPHFFIFSDDPQWCLENFKLKYPVTFVGHEHKGNKFANYLQLMTQCKHYIIPNSSFAWWAVWLNNNKNDKIVVAPKTWFADVNWDPKDLIPQNWIRVVN